MQTSSRGRRSTHSRRRNLINSFPQTHAERLESRWLLSGGPDKLVNNNNGATTTQWFTQSETCIVAFGNNVVATFNDSGSNNGGSRFSGWAYSSDNGNTWTDGGTLPTNANGDAGDPCIVRDNVTGRLYYSTLQFTGAGMRVFRSDDNGVTWQAPTQGAPGKSGTQDKEWMAVDNAVGAGQGNVYLIERDFGTGAGVYFFRSTDQGTTFGPNAGTAIVTGTCQGAFVAVGPDHSVYAFWLGNNNALFMRKSTDLGLTFGPQTTVFSGILGGTNGDLGLTGMRNGTATFNSFRSNAFPHVAINPITGDLYAVYNNRGSGTDKADIFLVQSTNGGISWSSPIRVNDDATTTDQWQPTVAITPDGTKIGVFYSSRQEDAANNLFKYYGRIGTLAGGIITFAPSEAISDVASLPEFGRDAVVNSVYMGDYNFASATNSAFHVLWSDNRSALPGGGTRMDPNVYYDQIPITVQPNGVWDGGGDGVNWTDPINWSNNVLPGPADDAIIDVPGNHTVILASGAQSVHSLTSAENLTITGGSLTIAQPSSITGSFTLAGGTLVGVGDITLSNADNVWSDGSMSGTGRLIVSAGATLTLTTAAPKVTTKPLQIDGLVTLDSGANQVLQASNINLTAGADLDLNDNDMILDYAFVSQLPAIQSLINNARAGGAWTGHGMTSTAAKNNALHNTTLGAIEATDYAGATFDGQTLDNSMVLVKYTYYGDTDFNGTVNFDDYVRTDSGFNNHRTGWSNGDFNGDGQVNFDDYVLIDLAFNTQGAVLRHGSSTGRVGSGRAGRVG